jgi:hypothetical protein
MTRAALASILVLSLVVPATADVTITQSTTGKGMGMSGTTTIKLEGSGPMAGRMAKMGGMSATTKVTEVSAGTLADELFAAPAGYKVKERK